MPLMRETKLIDDKLKMCGVFDRIDKITNDEYAIVEYKTSKKFDKPSIQRQLTFYKVLWENTLNKGKIKYFRYINPRIKEYQLIPYNSKFEERLFMDIANMRKSIETNQFEYKCGPVKHIVCGLCDFDECGLYKEGK